MCMYCKRNFFRTPVSNKAHLGVVHVRRKVKDNTLVCSSGSGCDRIKVGIGKKTKTHTKCTHEEIVSMFVKLEPNKDGRVTSIIETPNKIEITQLDTEPMKDTEKGTKYIESEPKEEDVGMKYLDNTSKWIYENEKIGFSNLNMGKIQKDILEQNKLGWPSVYQTEDIICPKCGSNNISKAMMHQGSKRAFLLTREICQPIEVRIKKCGICFIVIQPKHPLLLNIGDNLLVSKDVMFLMREMIHTCGPLSTAAKVILSDIGRNCEYLENLSSTEKEWINRRLAAGFLAMEALDEDEEWSQICATCGIIPDMTQSDGGEDICVTLQEKHFKVSEGYEDGTFSPESANDFLRRLKIYHIGALVYPAVQFKRDFDCNISNTPPFILPAYQGDMIYNTEIKKDTRYLEAKVIKGEQQLLIDMLSNSEFSLSELEDSNLERAKAGRLKDLLNRMGFKNEDTRILKSNMQKKKAIMDLYNSISSGYSQCHHTGNRLRASGGWYIEMCPHGVTRGSKFLYCSESVRDVLDIKLSTNYVSPVNVLDTPCTAASHLLTRDKKTATVWFGDKRGTFEKPVRNKPPSELSIPELTPQSHKKKITDLPSKGDLEPHEHPYARNTQKYFCGDRFHDKRFPHKSELCRYHNINLVRELKTGTTSMQENVNSMRNRLRLRNTCTQNVPTHLFYNAIVMDRAHNREIVKKQAEQLNKDVSKRHPEWKHVV